MASGLPTIGWIVHVARRPIEGRGGIRKREDRQNGEELCFGSIKTSALLQEKEAKPQGSLRALPQAGNDRS
jgi:hypothetical protein